MSEPVRLEVQDHVATLTLDRPETFNALDLATAAALADALLGVSSDPRVRAVVLTGAGRAFSAGGDCATPCRTRTALPPPSGSSPPACTCAWPSSAAWTSP